VKPAQVAVVMGSASDAEALEGCREVLADLNIPFEARVLSAHRTPGPLEDWLATLETRGIQVLIAAAGMAAHLAGVCAAKVSIPVIGVPLASGDLKGLDALLSTAQMPGGVPVATMGIGSPGGRNAALFAARILALRDADLEARLAARRTNDAARVLAAKLPPAWEAGET
jgi:phosphoribosylaminoimidazole carboxylase PurE protein